MIGIPALLLLGASALAIADVPNTFADGDTLSAAKMNANFKDIDERLAKAAVFTNSETMETYSLNGGVCGVTAAVDANIGGYAAAKTMCKQKCGNSATAHMCTSEEL